MRKDIRKTAFGVILMWIGLNFLGGLSTTLSQKTNIDFVIVLMSAFLAIILLLATFEGFILLIEGTENLIIFIIKEARK